MSLNLVSFKGTFKRALYSPLAAPFLFLIALSFYGIEADGVSIFLALPNDAAQDLKLNRKSDEPFEACLKRACASVQKAEAKQKAVSESAASNMKPKPKEKQKAPPGMKFTFRYQWQGSQQV